MKTCRAVYGLDKPAVVIPHGVSLPLQEIPRKQRDILFVGRFEDRKGVDILLQAWAAVCNHPQYDDRKLHLVGRDMPGMSGSYLQDCLEKLPNLRQTTIVIHGELPDEKLDRLRQGCAIAVIPSRYESFGMVALEAFAAGHVVIASRTGGLQEVVEEGKTGLLFTNENAEALSAIFLHMITDTDLQNTLAAGGQRALSERFSIDHMVAQSIHAYKQAINIG